MTAEELKNNISTTLYYKWNKALAQFFFNEDKAEKEVYLFITKEDIVKIGKTLDLNGSDQEIFENFISAIRSGLPGTKEEKSVLHQAVWAYELWKKTNLFDRINDIPLYFNYLILFILPLTEFMNQNFRHNVYYPELHPFLEKNNLSHFPSQNRSINWNPLWEDLESWSIIDRNMEIGFFELHKFRNKNWVYVGKPLSQCIFPVKAIKKLPIFFEKAGLAPNDEISANRLRELIEIHGSHYLSLLSGIIKTIIDPHDELGLSIIHLIKRKYLSWDGASDQYDNDTKTSQKGLTVAQLRMCLKFKQAMGTYSLYFRIYSTIDLPEDLCFEGLYKCNTHGLNWSKPISNLPFKKRFVLNDKLNKWKAAFTSKTIRLFIEGKYFNLNDWVEISRIKYYPRILILAENNLSDSIEKWGRSLGDNHFFIHKNFQIMPEYILYEVRSPQINHPNIEILQYNTEKRIIFKNGLKLSARKWSHELLPKVELENGRGQEKLFLEYVNGGDKLILERINTDQLIWNLPGNIKFNTDFYIKIENENTIGDGYKYQIIRYHDRENNRLSYNIPIRDLFGQILPMPDEGEPYTQGLETFNINKQQQKKYEHYFRPKKSRGTYCGSQKPNYKTKNDLLIKYLTMKGYCKTEKYFEAFETIFNNNLTSEEIEKQPIDLPRLKRWSLNYLDYMGHIDYEYSTKTIVINSARLILVPTHSGRKAVLIGDRTQDMVDKLYQETIKAGFQFNISEQEKSIKAFLLPNNISILGFSTNHSFEIEEKLNHIARECSIHFDEKNYPQCSIAELSGDIVDYENGLEKDISFDDHGWIAKIFDYKKLRFLSITEQDIDKSYSLVEYKLNEYTYKHKFWIYNVAFDINKNWGRYLILKKYNKNVIFYDEKKELLAVPVSLPLPRLLAQSMTLCSGKAPCRQKLELGGLNTWFNLYENVPSIFAYNKFQKVGQNKKEINIL